MGKLFKLNHLRSVYRYNFIFAVTYGLKLQEYLDAQDICTNNNIHAHSRNVTYPPIIHLKTKAPKVKVTQLNLSKRYNLKPFFCTKVECS